MNKYLYISNKKNLSNGLSDVSVGNLGDLSGYHILDYYFKLFKSKYSILPINKSSPQFKETKSLISSVGSVLDVIIASGKESDVIGSGSITNNIPVIKNKINFLGVRGHETKKLIDNQIKSNITVASDLGLLLPNIFPNKNIKKDKKIGFIIHSVDRDLFFNKYPLLMENLVDNYSDFTNFVNNLNKYEFIISSSLHGIIFSHAYGIPCAGIKITDKIIGNDFKYIDYYSSINFNYSGRIDSSTLNFYNNKELIKLVEESYNPNTNLIQNLQLNQVNLLYSYAKK